MLLSYNHNINNSRSNCSRMMDDFIEQDWFADSEDINNKHHAVAVHEQQSPLNVPTDVHFLELNVPVDENIYYANEEQSIQNHYFSELPGTSRSFETPQNGERTIGTFLPSEHIQENTNYGPMDASLMAHNAEEKSHYIDLSSSTNSLTILKSCTQQQESLNRIPQPQVHYQQGQTQHQWLNNHPPPPIYHQYDQISENGQHQQYMNLQKKEVIISQPNNERQSQPCHNSMVQYEEDTAIHIPTAHFPNNSTDKITSSNGHILYNARQQQFQSNSSLLARIEPNPAEFRPCQEVIKQMPEMSNQVQSPHMPIPVASLRPSPPQFECGSAKTIVRKSSKPKKKQTTQTKQFMSKETGKKQTQILKNPLITETSAEPSSGLDKIAKKLFTNQSTATLEFNDPHLAFEFSTLMSRCSQLMEQKEAGINVDAELKMVEVRIADYISTAETVPVISESNQPQNVSTCSPATAFSISDTQKNNHSIPEKRKSRPKKKPPSKPTLPLPTTSELFDTSTIASSSIASDTEQSAFGQQEIIKTVSVDFLSHQQSTRDSMPETIQTSHIFQQDGTNALLLDKSEQNQHISHKQGINGQSDEKQQFRVTSTEHRPENDKKQKMVTHDLLPITQAHALYPTSLPNISHSKPHSSSSKTTRTQIYSTHSDSKQQQQHYFVYQQNKDSNIQLDKKEQIVVLIPEKSSSRSSTNKEKHVLYSKNTIKVVVKETQEEIAARKTYQREKRKKSLTEQFERMYQQINIQDYQNSFGNKFDCIQRLLPFGLFVEPEFSHEFLYKFDAEIQRHSELMFERQKSIEKQLQSIMFRQAMTKMENEQNLLLFLDGYYMKDQFRREIIEKDPKYLDRVEHLVDTSCKPELDWEFNQWSPDLYTHSPPITITPPIQEQPQTQFPFKDEIEENDNVEFVELSKHLNKSEFSSTSKKSIGSFAELHVHLQSYQAFNETIHEEEKCEEIVSFETIEEEDQNTIKENEVKKNAEDVNKNLEDQSELHKNLNRKKLEPKLTLLEESRINQKLPTAQPTVEQFSLEMITNQFISMMPPAMSALKSSEEKSGFLVPILAEDIVVMRPESMQEIEASTKSIEQKQLVNDCEKKEMANEFMDVVQEPVKLKIKLGTRKEDIEKLKEEKKRKKELKRMKKKARKEAKHLKEEQSKCNENHNHIYENGAGPSNNYTISSGGQEGNKVLIPIEKSPLKISLRLIPKHGENTGISIESSEKINTLQKEEYITGGSMLKLRISKLMLHQNSSTSNIQQIEEEKREEREARKKKKKETKKRKSVIEEIKEEQPIKKIPRIKIRFGNSIKHKDPQQQQQPSPTILSTVPNTSSIMIPLCASQTFEEPPRSINYSDVTTTNFQKEEMKMESQRVHFSPCCSDDESESELRQRTNKLLSRIDRLL